MVRLWHRIRPFLRLLTVAGIALTLMTMCGGPTQVADSPAAASAQGSVPTPQPVPPGGSGTYANGYALPAVTAIYSLTVEVLAAPGQLTQFSFQGESHAVQYGNGYGSASGYISGGTSGKGFLRVKIMNVSWHDPYTGIVKGDESWAPLVAVGDTLIIKTEDSKASALGQGDIATLLCREDQEFVAPAGVNEIPTLQSRTRELDNCRMLRPQFVQVQK